jgi:hypothetical protein
VNALLIKLKPVVTAEEIIKKYGTPSYTTTVDYSPQEVAIALIFPEVGLITWITPGDANSTVKPTDPAVIILYLDPRDFDNLISTATLQGWNGYLPYRAYKYATPVVTPRMIITPAP